MKKILVLFAVCSLSIWAADTAPKKKEVVAGPPTDIAAQAEYSKRVAYLMGAQNAFINSLTSQQKAAQENIVTREKAAAEQIEVVAKSCPEGTELDRTQAGQLIYICKPKAK